MMGKHRGPAVTTALGQHSPRRQGEKMRLFVLLRNLAVHGLARHLSTTSLADDALELAAIHPATMPCWPDLSPARVTAGRTEM